MSYLLVQSCSARKQYFEQPVPALELYDGYFYRIIKNSAQYQTGTPDVDIRIISAKHGILRPDEPIGYYEQQMDTERAQQLRDSIVPALQEVVQEGEYDRVVINLGKQYQKAVEGFAESIDVPVTQIDGDGIGEKGHILKRFLNGDTTVAGGVK